MYHAIRFWFSFPFAYQFFIASTVRPETSDFVQVGVNGQLRREHLANASFFVDGGGKPNGALSLGENHTAKERMGIRSNRHYSFMAVLTSFVTSFVMFFGGVTFVKLVSPKVPFIYSYNAQIGALSSYENEGGLVLASMRLQMEDVAGIFGLDSALLIHFSEFGIKLMVCLGIPLLISAPLNFAFGEETPGAISRFSMENLKVGHQLHWMHCVLVWLVVWISQHLIIDAQLKFVDMRIHWLQTMPPPRSTTVMVENIPTSHRSDHELRRYFGRLFGDEFVEHATVVKHTESLKRLCTSWDQYHSSFQEALHEWEQSCRSVDKRPRFIPAGQERDVDTMDHYVALMKSTEKAIEDERSRIMQASLSPGDRVCSAAGFVTFNARHKAATAAFANCKADIEEMSTQIPPAPTDVIYEDLMLGMEAQLFSQIIGWSLILILFLSFLPIVFFVASLSSLSSLRKHVQFVETFCENHPDLQAPLEGALASSVLTLSNSFVPTLLQLIFNGFFVMKAASWAQMHLHVAYFWFQMLFIVLASAIGNSLLTTAERVAENPNEIFQILATTLPSATHFFVNFVLIQIGTLGLDITRYLPLLKFLAFRSFTPEDRAKELAEPEDQDYDGLGSRSARGCIILVIGLIYGTLCPLLILPVFIYFCANRLVKGYLIIFAETRKHDSGGVFWAQMLDHVFQSLFIYVFLMSGVLHCRGCSIPGTAHLTQGVVVAPALFFLYLRYQYFSSIQWKHLSFEAISSLDAESTKRPHLRRQRSSWHMPADGKCKLTYEQPELGADYCSCKDLLAELVEEMPSCPSIGVIRCEYQSETILGDAHHRGSLGYKVVHRVVPGMTWEMLDNEAMTADVERNIVDAIRWLETEGVCCLMADCGIMMPFQRVAERLASVPVVISSLMQCPLVCAALAEDEQILIITAWEVHSPQRERLLSHPNFSLDLTRFVVASSSHLSAFPRDVDSERRMACDLIALAKEWIARYPKVRAIILESIEASLYADALKLDIDLPVFDAITICNFYNSACDDEQQRSADDSEEHDDATLVVLGCLDVEGIPKDDYQVNAHYEVKHRSVKGLTLEMCRTGEVTTEVAANFKDAISWLERNGAVGITAKFPLLLHLQRLAREFSSLPIFISSLVMLPLLQAFTASDGKLLVISSLATEFEKSKNAQLTKLGLASEADRLVVTGVDGLPGADKIEVGMPADHELFEPRLVELALKVIGETPTIRAVLLEALPLTRYADVLRQTLSVPVFDAVLICEFYHSGSKDDRRCGSSDWQLPS